MTFVQLAMAIAAATMVNVVLLGFAWKATQQERRRGRAPWYLEVGLVAYIATSGLILYLLNGKTIAGSAEVFGAALVGEVTGSAIIFGLFRAIYRKDVQPTGQRIFEIGMSLFMLVVVIGALFA